MVFDVVAPQQVPTEESSKKRIPARGPLTGADRDMLVEPAILIGE